MATDIAFVVGCMTVLGRRVPHGLRVVMLTLAIADDIGAILVIAVGYSSQLHFDYLLLALGALALCGLLRWLGVRSYGIYAAIGAATWFATYRSGIHATLAGVALGLLAPTRCLIGESRLNRLVQRLTELMARDAATLPAQDRVKLAADIRHATRTMVSPVDYLIDKLHPWVSFGIMPLFALVNAGVPIGRHDVVEPVAVAVAVALLAGKPIGVLLASFAAVKSGLARLPANVSWRQMAGGGILAGIGFTMSLFIAELAFHEHQLAEGKVGVLCGSALSAVAGVLVLLPRKSAECKVQSTE